MHGLPRLAVRLPAAVWSRLVRRLVDLAAGAISNDTLEDVPAERLLLAQLAAGELPLTLAYVFPKLEGCQHLSGPARTAIANGLLASLDGEGIPHARLTRVWRPCWLAGLVVFIWIKHVAGKPVLARQRVCNTNGSFANRCDSVAATGR